MVKSVEGRVLFDDLVKQVDSRTRILSISSVECNSGFRCDLNRIGTFCKEKGVLFFVDAIQSLGVLPMDVKKDSIDFLSTDRHKWMLSVEGLSRFYIPKAVVDKIRPVTMGWGNVDNAENFMDYDFTLKKDAKKIEEGTSITMSIHAFGTALGLLLETGIDNIEKRVMHLGDRIITELNRRNIEIYSSTFSEKRSGNISFTLDKDVDPLYPYMMENKIKLTVRDGLVRFSPHFYNNEDEVLKVFDLLDGYLRK